jgi:hypothetical protein
MSRHDVELEVMLDGIAPMGIGLASLSCPWWNPWCGEDSDTPPGGEGGDIVDLPVTPPATPPPGGGQGPYGETPPGFVAPGAVLPRPEKWDLEAQPFALLTLTYGDTLVGLSATYLGDGARWREIYDTGSNRVAFPSPDRLDHVGPLEMPEEARANMKNWLKLGKPGTLPGKTPPETIGQKVKRNWPLIALVVVGVAGGGYLLTRS